MVANRLVVVVLVLAACGDDGHKPKDAPIDSPPDTPSCTVKNFTGELVDWDSNETTNFCGVNKAMVTVRTTGGDTDSTNPNGRFMVCVMTGSNAIVDVVPATTASECTSMPGTYMIGGMLFAEQALIDAHAMFSARAMSMARVTTFFTQVGQAYDATKGQVFVHVEGTQHPVAISSAHAATQKWNGTAWAAGDTGINVFFPNVDVGSGTTTISVTGGTANGAGAYPVVANKFTWVTIVGS